MTEVKEILAEAERILGLHIDRSRLTSACLGRCGRVLTRHISIEAPRGRSHCAALNWFFVRVASRRQGRSIWTHFEARIECATPTYWRIDLAKALADAAVKATEYANVERTRKEAQDAAEGARIEYATQLGEAIGRTVYPHQVIHNLMRPVGVQFTIRLTGTVEEVAEKFSRLLDIADQYKNQATL